MEDSMFIKRHLMTEVDAGSGNGAVVPPTTTAPADPQPQAQGVAAAPLTLETLAKVLEERDQKLHDRLFAAVRRDGGFSKKETKSKSDDAPTPQANPQIDPFKMRKLDFALTKHGIAAELTQSQYERAHRDFAAESPDDAEAWAKDYFHGHAKFAAPVTQAQPVTQPVTQPATPQPRTAVPVSDRGSPPVPTTPLEEQKILSMSPSDREALRRQKGDKWYTDKLLEESKTAKFQLR